MKLLPALALLFAGCELQPTYLDLEVPVTALREIGGVVPVGEGFLVAGTRRPESHDQRVAVTVTSTGAAAASRAYGDGRIHGVLPLSGGGMLFHGTDAFGVYALVVDAAGEVVAGGNVGTNETGYTRAAVAGAGGRLAIGGQGRGRWPWVAVFHVQDGELVLDGEATWRLGEGQNGEVRALAPRADGFLLGGSFMESEREGSHEHPILAHLGPDGTLGEANLYPGSTEEIGVNALLALGGDRFGVAVERDEGFAVGVIDAAGKPETRLTELCAGEAPPHRPVTLIAVDDGFVVAGWRRWGEHRLWLAATDRAGRARWMRTFETLTLGGTARIALAQSPAGGLVLASTLCPTRAPCGDGDPTGRPMLWHLDPDGGPYGAAGTTACP